MLEGARLGIVPVAVKVNGVVPRVVEDAVENDADTVRMRCVAELGKVFIGAKHRIDMQVVRCVVAVVAHRLKDGVEIDRRHTHLNKMRQLFLQTLQRAAVKVPGGNRVVGVALVGRRCVPVLYDTLGAADALLGGCGLAALAPCVVAGKTVWKDLVDESAFIPCGPPFTWTVEGELKRGHFMVVVDGALSTLGTCRGADSQLWVSGDVYDEAVPHDRGRLA